MALSGCKRTISYLFIQVPVFISPPKTLCFLLLFNCMNNRVRVKSVPSEAETVDARGTVGQLSHTVLLVAQRLNVCIYGGYFISGLSLLTEIRLC